MLQFDLKCENKNKQDQTWSMLNQKEKKYMPSNFKQKDHTFLKTWTFFLIFIFLFFGKNQKI